MRKLISRLKEKLAVLKEKLAVGLKASAASEEAIGRGVVYGRHGKYPKPIDERAKAIRSGKVKVAAATALIAATVASAQAGGGNYGGGTFDQNNTGGSYAPNWSVWGSLWEGIKSPFVWIYGIGQIDKSFDNGSDPGQGYYNSGPVQADHGPGGNGSSGYRSSPYK